MFRLALGLVALLALPAHAGPQKRAAEAMGVEIDGGRPLAGALAKAGWIATPEGSDRYQPGNIYTEAHALWSARAGCFDGEPLESIYNELEVIQSLQAGARVPLGLVTASVEGMRYKRLTYADPMVTELEGRSLKLNEGCGRDLAAAAAGADVSTWYVVQAVLLAVVNEQECTELEASARTLVGGGGVSVSEECSRGSVGQVAVAYKVQPVSALLGGSVTQPTPPAARTPEPAGPRGSVSSSGGFDGTLDVSAAVAEQAVMAERAAVDEQAALAQRLAEQACVREAERLGAAERDARLDRAEAELQKEARDAWGQLEPQAEACLQLDDRAACVSAVEQFIAWAEGLQVAAEAGYERVAPPDCGDRSAALAAVSRSVPVAEQAPATAMLGRLKATGGGRESYDVLGYRMVALPGGTFTMGCTKGQGGECSDIENPAHRVSVSPFWLGSTEVTQRLYQEVMGSNPSKFSACGADCPVEQVSWFDSASFANALSKQEGLRPAYVKQRDGWVWDRSADGYRLPTEAEWEYAARAGEDTRYAGGKKLGAVGWYGENSGGTTHPVGQKAPNAFGLYDMSGNVGEWCLDRFSNYTSGSARDPVGGQSATQRISRGGRWSVNQRYARVSYRTRSDPTGRNTGLGLRLARSSP